MVNAIAWAMLSKHILLLPLEYSVELLHNFYYDSGVHKSIMEFNICVSLLAALRSEHIPHEHEDYVC